MFPLSGFGDVDARVYRFSNSAQQANLEHQENTWILIVCIFPASAPRGMSFQNLGCSQDNYQSIQRYSLHRSVCFHCASKGHIHLGCPLFSHEDVLF